MDAPVIQFSHFPFVTKATVDAARMCATAILTYPIVDLAGDYIAPTGGDYARHKAVPWVGLEHYRLKKGTKGEVCYPDHADAGRPIVAGWARESLSEDDGTYSVEFKQFTIKGQKHTLPVGTTFYDADNRLSNQVFAMVKQDALPGVSLELQAPDGYTPKILKAKSPLEPHRPAWQYDRWECHAWVSCAKPVNPGALVTKSVHDDALASILSRGKVSTDQGSSESLHPLILKSLARYLPEGKSKAVVGGFSAEKAMPFDQTGGMDDDKPDEPTVYDDAHEDQVGDEQGTPTARAAYNAAQMCMDLCGQIQTDLEGSEHKSGKKAVLKLCEQLEAMAHKAIAIGDKVVADLGGDEGESNFDSEDDDDVEDDATETDDEDDEKRMKARRAPHRQIYFKAIKRFTAREVKEAPVVELPEPAPEPEPGNGPDDIERLKKARERRRRLKFLHGE